MLILNHLPLNISALLWLEANTKRKSVDPIYHLRYQVSLFIQIILKLNIYSSFVRGRLYYYIKNTYLIPVSRSKRYLCSMIKVKKKTFVKIRCSAKLSRSHKFTKSPRGVGFYFLLASSEISGKKPHPPWGFCRKPL